MQNSNINLLASRLKEMENPKTIGISIGSVVNTEPFSVSISDGLVILTEGEELSVCESLKKTKLDAQFTWENESKEGTITIDPKVKKGDMILVVPMADEQSWIAVDRIGE